MTAFLGLWRVWLALGAVVVAFLAGVQVEGDHRDSQQLALEHSNEAAYRDTVKRQRAAKADVSIELAATRAAAGIESRNLRERISHATQFSTCQPAEPVALAPAADGRADRGGVSRFTAEFVRLWDDALWTGLPAAERAGGTAAATGGPDPVEARDLLDNHTDNAAICNDLRAQIRAWQAWAIKNGLAH
jgi:hypothetical protein